MYVWILSSSFYNMADPESVDLGKVATGTLLLVVSSTILVATGYLDSPLPVLALAVLPTGLFAALWIRTGEGSFA